MIAVMFTLLLAAQEATPVDASRECEPTDNACNARTFLAKAAKARPPKRALYLFTAHRSFVALFARTGEMRHLCDARMNFDRSLAITGQSEAQRANFERSRSELEALERKHGSRCGPPHKRKTQSAKVAQETPAAQSLAVTRPAPTEPEPLAPPPLLTRAVPHVAPPTVDAPLEQRPTPPSQPRKPGRPLVIAGGATLGLGVVLTGIAGYAASRVGDSSSRAFEQFEKAHSDASDADKARQAELRREYDRWLPVTVGTAVVGGTAVIVGALLIRAGVRKLRGPSRAALVPMPGGLAFHARF